MTGIVNVNRNNNNKQLISLWQNFMWWKKNWSSYSKWLFFSFTFTGDLLILSVVCHKSIVMLRTHSYTHIFAKNKKSGPCRNTKRPAFVLSCFVSRFGANPIFFLHPFFWFIYFFLSIVLFLIRQYILSDRKYIPYYKMNQFWVHWHRCIRDKLKLERK